MTNPSRPPLALLIVCAVILAACGGRGSTGGGGGNAQSFGGDDAIRWPRDASHTVFEIDVTGGDAAFANRNDIPLCAIYGDNRIVWLDNSQPNQTIVLFDVLEDINIYNWVTDLTVNKRIFEYEGNVEERYPEGERPVYEEIVLDVNGTRHVSDGFAQWPDSYFRDVLTDCTSLSLTPALYEPSAGWLSAQGVDRAANAATIYWNAEGAGINLNDLARSGERVWVDDPFVVNRVWNAMTNSPRFRQFAQGDAFFEVAFEVPNIHPSAPPVPGPDEIDRARTMPSERDDDE